MATDVVDVVEEPGNLKVAIGLKLIEIWSRTFYSKFAVRQMIQFY